MKVALVDVDNMNKKKIAFPNLPIMKLSAYHKQRDDTVEWWIGIKGYDVAYKSKIFSSSPESQYPIYADAVIEGGTGYGTENKLPQEVENIMPDYNLYPQFNAAYGFLTRGCPRKCPFCIVSVKEGCKAEKVADLQEFWSGQPLVKLLDPNLLAYSGHEEILQQLISSGAWVDFTQGLDIRLTTPEAAHESENTAAVQEAESVLFTTFTRDIAQSITITPQYIKDRTEWKYEVSVRAGISSTTVSPFCASSYAFFTHLPISRP